MASRKRLVGFLVLVLAVMAVLFMVSRSQKEPVPPADLILINGKIATVDAQVPSASWLAARAGRVQAVGADAKGFNRYVGPGTEIVDLGGAMAVPGLIESHGHFTGLGQSKMELDLTTARSWDDIVAMVAEAVKTAKPGEWITGRGWHQDKWDRVPEPNVAGLPYDDALSKVSPENPVLLVHASGHSALANAKAMELSNITDRTPDPDGGEIVRDPKGRAIGAFVDNAMGLVRSAAGRLSPEEAAARERREVELAAKECLAHGVTTFHDAGASFGTVDLYKKMAEEGALPVRLYVMVSAESKVLAERGAAYRMIGAVDNRLTVRSIKRLMDGALGSHSAWLLEPYADLPTSTGLNTESIDEIRATARFAIENGWQLATHAIGDRADRETLDLYEEAFKAHPDKTDLRWRIEHSQHINPADIPRFGTLGVIAAMQAVHCTS